MNIEPLSKAIYDKAILLGVTSITLNFSGGNDEGNLNIQIDGSSYDEKFESEVMDWAWKVYNYSGAGDGTDYGDDITYNLINKTAYSSEWSMSRVDGEMSDEKLVVSPE